MNTQPKEGATRLTVARRLVAEHDQHGSRESAEARTAETADRRFAVTIFPTSAAREKAERPVTLAELAAVIKGATQREKAKLPWLKLARFGEAKTHKGSLRSNANVIRVTGVEGDYDAGEMSIDGARLCLDIWGIAALLYETPSSTPDAPRWRVVAPFSKELPPDARERHLARLNGALGGVLSRESFTLSQSYYFGSIEGKAPVRVELIGGRFIDQADDLDTFADGPVRHRDGDRLPETAARTGLPPDVFRDALMTVPNDGSHKQHDDRAWWLEILAAVHFETEGSDAGRALVHEWSAGWPGYDEAETERVWNSFRLDRGGQPQRTGMYVIGLARNAGWHNAEFEAQLASGVFDDLGEGAEGAPGPVIRIEPGNLAEAVDRAEAALIAANAPIYVRGDRLWRPVIDPVEITKGRTAKVARLAPVTVASLVDLLSRPRVARWRRYDGRKKKFRSANPDKQVAETLLARDGEWPYRRLAGLITTPTLRPDGTILATAGYDPATRLLLMAPPDMPAIPDRPSRDDALSALETLDGLLVDFPVVDGASRSVALSALITPVVRGALTTAPLHLIRAPASGTGKSYLTELAAAISTGQHAPTITAGHSGEEIEKRVGAALIEGQSIICIDNLNSELGGDALCQFVERPVAKVRRLGESRNIQIENRATFYANGNNLIVTSDMVRRVITCSLDANREHPEKRQYSRDPFGEILADRGRYVAAALTVARAYLVAECPGVLPAVASFEDWSRIVRSPLVWLGRDDPATTIEVNRVDDPERNSLSEVVSAWRAKVGLRTWLTAGGLAEAANDDGPGYFAQSPLHVALANALGRAVDGHAIGYWLRRFQNRIVDGCKIVSRENKKTKQKEWALVAPAGDGG